MGRVFALGTLSIIVVPMINAAFQKLTGSPNSQLPEPGPVRFAAAAVAPLVQSSFGKAHLPQAVLDYYNNDRSLARVLSGLVSFAPVYKEVMETAFNKDYYSGKAIVEPGDMAHYRVGRVAGQFVEHAAENFMFPYSVLARASQEGNGVKTTMEDWVLGAKEKPSPQKQVAIAKAKTREQGQAKARAKKPRGPIEGFGG
jgi:hypothetical protein